MKSIINNIILFQMDEPLLQNNILRDLSITSYQQGIDANQLDDPVADPADDPVADPVADQSDIESGRCLQESDTRSVISNGSSDGSSDGMSDDRCEICFEEAVQMVELACGHKLCNICKGKLRKQECPWCRKPFPEATTLIVSTDHEDNCTKCCYTVLNICMLVCAITYITLSTIKN